MNRIDRLFGMLTMLQSKRFVGVEAIAEKFEISTRTVYRDIKALCEQGIPISFEQGKGYGVVSGYFLPPVSFSMEEANALLLMESLVYGFADKSIQNHYGNALHKVRAVMKTSQKDKLDFLDSNIFTQLPGCVNHDFEYLSEIQTAISSHNTIEIDYKNAKDETSQRCLDPIGLVFYAMTWHLIGWCHLREEYRDFKVSRILGLRNTQMEFQRKDHINLNEYLVNLPVTY